MRSLRIHGVVLDTLGGDAHRRSCVLRPQVQQTFSLENAAQAYAASESGHARGKIVIAV